MSPDYGAALPIPLAGPAELAQAVIAARTHADWAPEARGAITEAGLQRVIQIAYHASQLPNEGYFPRLMIFVSAAKPSPRLTAVFGGELSVATLRRLGPVLASPQLALVVEERNGCLEMRGITSLADTLTDLAVGDPVFVPPVALRGLIVEIKAPGDLRAGEWYRHRLTGGHLYQEQTYVLEDWFEDWSNHLATELFGESPNPRRGLPIGRLWEHLIRQSAALRHGGCFVILDDPSDRRTSIRHQFLSSGLDLGDAFRQLWVSIETDGEAAEPFSGRTITENDVRARVLLRRQLLLDLETAALLSTTDGCVVFNRRLQLYSFGSMSELPAHGGAPVPCYRGDSTVPVDDEHLRNFGARRRAAIRICQSCPWALAFVISQDGDLRAVARRNDAVRLYENLTTW